MSDASTTFFTDEMAAHDAYKLCTGLIVPRPIGWIGSLSADGIANLAPYSFFNLIGNDLVIGEVVVVHVADRVLDGTRVDQSELRAVGRHAGNWYSHATDLFDLTRPA